MDSSHPKPISGLSTAGLPPGWLQGVDPNYKRPFYYNKRTRRSTWTKPLENAKEQGTSTSVVPMPQDSSRPSDTKIQMESPAGVFSRKSDRSVTSQDSPASGSTMDSSVISGNSALGRWIEVYSPEYKRTYFFNRDTKESRWTRPTLPSRSRRLSSGQEIFTRALDSSTQSQDSKVNTVSDPKEEVPALREAWEEIERARKELQREREQQTMKLRGEWSVLQSQVQQLRDLSLESSFSPVSGPLEKIAQQETLDDQNVASANSDPSKGDDKSNHQTRVDRTKKNAASQRGTSYTAGLLSELEEYADSLMKRTETMNYLQGTTGGREESRHVSRAARRARRMHSDDSDDDSDTESFDEHERDAYIENILGGLHETQQERSKSTKSNKDIQSMIPLAIEEEMEDVRSGVKAVLAEAEAVEKAKEAYKNLAEGCFYKLLQVAPDCSSIQLKKAYHKAMMKWHPDKYKGDEKEEATKKTSQLGRAYQTLSNPWERVLYDIMGVEQYLVHTNVITCFINYLVTGCKVKKHPRKTYTNLKFIDKMFVRTREFWLDTDHKHFCVARKRNLEPTEAQLKKIKRVRVQDVKAITKGLQTSVLTQTGAAARDMRYLSIQTDERTLDLEAPDNKQRDFLASRLTLLVIHLNEDQEWFEKFYAEGYNRKKKKKKKNSRKRKPRPPSESPPPSRYESDEY